MIQIRKMLKADAEAYRDLRLRALKTNPEAFGSAYEDSREHDLEFFRGRIPEPNSDSVIFVAEDNGQLMGMIGLLRPEQQKMRHRAMIWGVFVDPQARGNGLGRQLMDAMMTHIHQIDGLRHVSLTVVTTNTIALKLYQSYGFNVWGTEPEALFVDGRYYDEYYMNLRL
ncbi:MAG: GNAT family protein [Anaerolineae bacterium]|nr:GNAT family protein [Anaerolineae bacterium]MDQ7034783.1 GNAT family protein [Anaerolineae bacterium]